MENVNKRGNKMAQEQPKTNSSKTRNSQAKGKDSKQESYGGVPCSTVDIKDQSSGVIIGHTRLFLLAD